MRIAAVFAIGGFFSMYLWVDMKISDVVVWGIVLAVANVLVPAEWFWVVYLIQIINVSGAAGDLYVTYRFCAMPKDILVHDSGVAMEVYSAQRIR